MVNKASKKGHIPIRSCVICRKKYEKSNLTRFVIENEKIVLDDKQNLSSRGYYFCASQKCFEKLEKWLKKRKK